MTAENTAGETAMLLTIVADLLVGSAASPLRKALIDSGLGEDLSPVTGLERDLRQIAFAVGLRGTDPDKAPRIEALILDTLRDMAASGFDRELIEGTLHQVEFHGREMVRGNYPYGIVLMGRAYHTWLYDGDPLTDLNFPAHDPGNPPEMGGEPRPLPGGGAEDGSSTTPTASSPSWSRAGPSRRSGNRRPGNGWPVSEPPPREAEERIRRETVLLKRFQTEPDPPEAAATLPQIKIGDISREIETIPTERRPSEGVPVLRHELFTNGIAYLDLAFDVSDIPEELQPYLPLLGKLTVQMGAAGLSYEAMAKRISLRTGGLGVNLAAGSTADGRENWQKMVFSVKALYRNTDEAVRIVRDILTEGDLNDAARMRELILEKKNGLHAAVIPSGHIFAQMAAAAGLLPPGLADRAMARKNPAPFISGTADRLGDLREELREKLTASGRPSSSGSGCS